MESRELILFHFDLLSRIALRDAPASESTYQFVGNTINKLCHV